MAPKFKTQIKGIIRFSYLSESGYAMSTKGIDAVRDIIYDPDRLARRFLLFERLALHSVKLQHNADFKVGVLVGDTLPGDAKAHLKALVKDVPQMQIVTLPVLPIAHALKRAFKALGDDPDATHTATFRLDDDDAMHRLTTDRIAKLADALLAIRNAKVPFAIAFNRGFYLDPAQGEQFLSEWYEKTPLGIGLTLVTPVDARINVYRRNHRRLGEYFDCHTEIGRPMYIRSVHEDNDSAAKPTGRKGELSAEEVERALWRGFGLTLDDLKVLNVS
ncbi:MAG: glycosyltransferase [Sulfitobacter sp.]